MDICMVHSEEEKKKNVYKSIRLAYMTDSGRRRQRTNRKELVVKIMSGSSDRLQARGHPTWHFSTLERLIDLKKLT